MKPLFVLWFVVLMLSPAVAESARGKKDRHLYHCSQALLVEVMPDPLMRELEWQHAKGIDAGQKSRIGLSTFDLRWILDDVDATEKLMEYFDPSGGSSGARYAEGFVSWVNAYERLYATHIGTLSRDWMHARQGSPYTGKDLFIQAVMLKLAYRNQAGAQPTIWSTRELAGARLLAVGDIETYFGSLGEFQKRYDAYHRSQTGHRAPRTQIPEAESASRRALRSVGVRPEANRAWQPMVAADRRNRTHQEDLLWAIEAIESYGDSETLLAGLFVQRSEGEIFQNQFSFERYEYLEREFGSWSTFVQKLNRVRSDRGLPLITFENDVVNFAQELVVQVGVAYARSVGPKEFTGFHSESEDFPFRANLGHRVFVAARMSVRALNERVFRRLR